MSKASHQQKSPPQIEDKNIWLPKSNKDKHKLIIDKLTTTEGVPIKENLKEAKEELSKDSH